LVDFCSFRIFNLLWIKLVSKSYNVLYVVLIWRNCGWWCGQFAWNIWKRYVWHFVQYTVCISYC